MVAASGETHDVRGLYPKALLGPLAGVTSRSFAELAARVYGSAGIDVHLSERIMATPELSFAIRALGAQGGLMVSASHNPADDNGLKVLAGEGQKLDDALEDELATLVLRADELENPTNHASR